MPWSLYDAVNAIDGKHTVYRVLEMRHEALRRMRGIDAS